MKTYDLLVRDLQSSDHLVRKQACIDLGQLGDMRAVPHLIEALSDRHEYVGASAADALGKLGDRRAIASLEAAVSNRDRFMVCCRAGAALAELQKPRSAVADSAQITRYCTQASPTPAMSDATSTKHTAPCEPLLELATPFVYRRNLFRVLGLHINATPKDVQREQNRRRMQEKLGVAAGSRPKGPLDLDPAPGEDDIRAAMERINQPISRLLDEIFWFWPTNGDPASDPALEALKQGDVKQAADVWMKASQSGGDGHIATHNLAVLDHVVALDHEARLATSGLSKEEQKKLAELWLRSFSRWKQVFEGEHFWSAVKSRVRDIADVQLSTGFVDQVRTTLPTALLLISAKIAYGAAEKRDSYLAQRHIGLLQKAQFGDDLVDQAIREAIKPIRTRIKTATDTCKCRCSAKPHQGNQYVRELYEQARGMLGVVDAILLPNSPTRSSLHDLVAAAMLEGETAFSNKTNDWQEGVKLLELAQRVASGESLKAKLETDINTDRENAEAGNDWCSPGYWDLSENVVAQLESARAKQKAGDFDGTMRILVGLDPQIGKPLRRSLAYTLSLRGIRIHNDALGEYAVDNDILKTVMQRVLSAPDPAALLSRCPDPSPYAPTPPCLCCGKTSYTRWFNFTHKELPLFLCSTCYEAHKRELAQQKSTLCEQLKQSLEYIILANEIDPDDPGVRRNLASLKKTAGDFDCSIPTSTQALRDSLERETSRSRRVVLGPVNGRQLCHFCGNNPADDSCAIKVPMCTGGQPIELLFHQGTEYRHGEAVVPRCRRCRDEHRELPGRIVQWYRARLAAVGDEHFETLVQELRSAESIARPSVVRVEEEKARVARTQAALQQAESAHDRCPQCHSAEFWEQYLCRRCDETHFRLSKPVKLCAVVAAVLALGILYGLGSVINVHPVIVVAIWLGLGFKAASMLNKVQRDRRQRLSETRAEEARHLVEAVPRFRAELDRANTALKAAAEVAEPLVEVYTNAKKKLQRAKQRAQAEFEQLYLEPRLAAGIKPESAFLDFHVIQECRRTGWGFGSKPEGNGSTVGTTPVQVQGLVVREPRRPAAEVPRTPAAPASNTGQVKFCPSCGIKNEMQARFCGACGAQQPTRKAEPAAPAAAAVTASAAATAKQASPPPAKPTRPASAKTASSRPAPAKTVSRSPARQEPSAPRLNRNDEVAVHCYGYESTMREAYQYLRAKSSVWVEKRESTLQAMYAYWIVCRYSDNAEVARILDANSLSANSREYLRYGPGVTDQSKPA